MNYIYLTIFLTLFISTSGRAQKVDTTAARQIVPILSEQPVVFSKNDISEQLDALKQPVIPAQEVRVQDDIIKTRFDRHEALRLIIPEVNEDDVKKYYTRYLRKSGDGKLRSDGNRLSIDDVLIEEVSSDPFDVEFQMESNAEAVSIWVAMEKDSVALTRSSEPLMFSSVGALLEHQGKELYREKITGEIDREEKVLTKQQSELDQLIKNNERQHKKITDNNLKIEQTNSDLETNTIERKNAGVRVAARKDDLLSASKDNQKDAKKALKAAQKEKSKLDKDRGNMYEDLVSYQREIEENEQLISENLDNQRDLLLMIREQELLVEAYREKLASVE